jgi:hypothetical protein
MPDCDPLFPTSLHLCASFAVASNLLVEVDGEVAGLTLVVPSSGPAAGAERLVSQHELRSISTSVLSPQIQLRRTWRQGAKSSPLAMMHLW